MSHMQVTFTSEELANKRRVASNAVFQGVGFTVSLLTGITMTGLLARYLGTIGFGKLNLALTYFSFVGMIAGLGSIPILVREF